MSQLADKNPSPEQDKDVDTNDDAGRLANRVRTTITLPDGVSKIIVSTVALLGYESHAVYETLLSCNAWSLFESRVVERCDTFAERRAMHDKWVKRVKEKGRNCMDD